MSVYRVAGEEEGSLHHAAPVLPQQRDQQQPAGAQQAGQQAAHQRGGGRDLLRQVDHLLSFVANQGGLGVERTPPPDYSSPDLRPDSSTPHTLDRQTSGDFFENGFFFPEPPSPDFYNMEAPTPDFSGNILTPNLNLEFQCFVSCMALFERLFLQ